MHRTHRFLALALAAPVIALGCTKCGGTTTQGPAGTGPTASISDVPLTDSTLSFLQPQGSHCAWVRADPVSKKRVTVAAFPATCEEGRVTWTRDGKRGLVWLKVPGAKPAEGEQDVDSRENRLWEVSFATGATRQLPPVDPAAGPLLDVGYDQAGTPFALTMQIPPDTEEEVHALTYGGQSYDITTEGDGLPALAHAFALDPSGSWKHAEAKPTTTGWDYAAETDALDVEKKLNVRSQKLLDMRPDGEQVEDEALLQKLQQAAPDTDPEGNWLKLAGTPVPVYVWEIQGEFVDPTNRILVAAGEQLKPLPKLTSPSPEAASVQTRGPYLLVTKPEGDAAKLYDLRTIALVGSEDDAQATTFWPAPATAPVPQKAPAQGEQKE